MRVRAGRLGAVTASRRSTHTRLRILPSTHTHTTPAHTPAHARMHATPRHACHSRTPHKHRCRCRSAARVDVHGLPSTIQHNVCTRATDERRAGGAPQRTHVKRMQVSAGTTTSRSTSTYCPSEVLGLSCHKTCRHATTHNHKPMLTNGDTVMHASPKAQHQLVIVEPMNE
jgi:hypothetical protein